MAKPKAKADGKAKVNGTLAERNEGGEDPFNLFESIDNMRKGDKRLSIERIYQRKTQLEHILLRPDTYIGSVEPVTQVS